MVDTAGSLLLRAGLVNETQLAEAERLRQRDGGTIGECLVRLAALDEDRLVEFFHERLMVPRVEPEQFERVPRPAVDSVPGDMAAEFRVFPVDIDGEGTLTLAMADPADAAVADEVGFFTSRFCQRAVAHPSLIRAAINHYYKVEIVVPPLIEPPVVPVVGVPVHEEGVSGVLHGAFPEELEAQEAARAARSQEPEQELEPEEAPAPVVAERPRADTPPPLPPPPDESEPPPLGDDDVPITAVPYEPPAEEPVLLTKVKEREAEPVWSEPAEFDVSDVGDEPEPGEPILLTRRVVGTTPPAPPPVVPDPPLGELRVTHTRDEIAHILIGYVSQMAPRAALFVVRRGALVGFYGAPLNPEALRRVQIPLDVPSLFRDVIQSRLPYRGQLGSSAVSRQFAERMGALPGDVMLFPVAVREKVVAIVYADGIHAPLPDASLHAAAREAGRAYERLILARKR